MLLTVTLNVAIDKRYVVSRFCYGEVLRVREADYTAGGKGINVTRIARLLGEEVTAAGFIAGHAGDYVREQLEAIGATCAFTRVPGESRSCINLFDEATGVTTELLEPGITVSPQDLELFFDQLDGLAARCPVVCISGSTPNGVPSDVYFRMIQLAKRHGCKVLLDTSGENLRHGIAAAPALVKPNREELQALMGEPIEGEEALIAVARSLQKQGIETVVVSLGRDGALVIDGQAVYRGATPPVPVVNTVSCGDSMVGAFAVAMLRRLPMEEAIRLAMAVSTANAMCMETGHFEQAAFERLLGQVEVHRLR